LPRFKIEIQYIGSSFSGWQKQDNGPTVQEEIESALSKLNKGKRISVTGAGRTDSGVHASGQVAHFDFDTDMPSCKLKDAINGNMKGSVRINSCGAAKSDFHARFSATARKYVYTCRTDGNILDGNLVWQTGPLNLDILNNAAGCIVGEHDFTSFSKQNPEVENRVCNVSHSAWFEKEGIVNYEVKANRFLHHMVRYLVGTMVEISRGKITMEAFQQLVNKPAENVRIYKAPPQGLRLEKVIYDP
jgi:tRNA pseudouridine38-40 synthase